jgi:SAM-dependent methyltransferase
MDLQDYWQKKLIRYSQESWSSQPSIFAAEVLPYLPFGGSLLDLGAGLGQDSRFFAQKGYRVLATDFSPYALKQIKGVSTRLVDLSLPLRFPPASFDIVYSHLALQYFDLSRTMSLFSEIYSVLKPEGIFAILLNTLDDPEIEASTPVGDDLYLTPGGLQKRYFSISTLRPLVENYEILLLDNHGRTQKDSIQTLIRFVGRKPPSLES